APPDHGLTTKQTSRKKKDKFYITIGFACNANGSEKLEPFFVGKAKKQGLEECGFFYHHNKKAWMTADLFDE
ncbi:hypothetical protein PAXRUDRAFT_150715, partial [Paxillus rubicundulus Ve08.2h10]